MKNFLDKLINSIKLLSISDKSLIIISFILLTQCIVSLFTKNAPTKQSGNIDVVLRSSIASIFGYFISGNFINNNNSTLNNTSEKNTLNENFTNNKNNPTLNNTNAQNTLNENPIIPRSVQITLVSTFGVASLIVLMLARNFVPMWDSDLQTIDLLKDMISGCIGFLIGQPYNGKHK